MNYRSWRTATRVFVAPFVLALPALASAATITVNSVADTVANDGSCTLREAITAANTNTAPGGMAGECAAGAAGTDTIEFNIATGCNGVTGVCTIQPAVLLPTITEPVTINGYTQTGAVMNSLAVGNNASLKVEIDGSNVLTTTTGLIDITAGSSTVMGLVINRAQTPGDSGLRLATNGGNIVKGNFIGTTADGTIGAGNGCANLRIASSSNTIGGLLPADRNVISNAQSCSINVALVGSANQILNNYIGTNAAGTGSLGGLGIDISGTSTGNVIGGTSTAARNVISPSGDGGLRIRGVNVSGTQVLGNFIGTNASGTGSVGATGFGITFTDGAHDNVVGGLAAGAANLIAFNGSADGIVVSTTATRNEFRRNSIHSNGGLGIDFANDGVTPNDAGDGDTGPNDLQNFPVITGVTSGPGSTTIDGTLNTTPSTSVLIEFFASLSCDPSGNGEGQTFLQETTAVTDVSGNLAFSFSFGTGVPAGQVITATATSYGPVPIQAGMRPLSIRGVPVVGSTSEFSACFTVGGGATSTPTSTATATPTATPTVTPGGPTFTPTPTPTVTATPTVTVTPGGPTFTPTATPTPTPPVAATATATPTSAPPTATPTIIGGGGGPPLGSIPTLSGGMLALLAVVLAGIAVLLIRRQ